jgi:hypothetical protein
LVQVATTTIHDQAIAQLIQPADHFLGHERRAIKGLDGQGANGAAWPYRLAYRFGFDLDASSFRNREPAGKIANIRSTGLQDAVRARVGIDMGSRATGDYRPYRLLHPPGINATMQPVDSTPVLSRRLFIDFLLYRTCACSGRL